MNISVRPRFSPIVQMGHIIQAVSFGSSLLVASWIVSSKVTANEKDISTVQSQVNELKIQTTSTLQTLNSLAASVARIEGQLTGTKEK